MNSLEHPQSSVACSWHLLGSDCIHHHCTHHQGRTYLVPHLVVDDEPGSGGGRSLSSLYMVEAGMSSSWNWGISGCCKICFLGGENFCASRLLPTSLILLQSMVCAPSLNLLYLDCGIRVLLDHLPLITLITSITLSSSSLLPASFSSSNSIISMTLCSISSNAN